MMMAVIRILPDMPGDELAVGRGHGVDDALPTFLPLGRAGGLFPTLHLFSRRHVIRRDGEVLRGARAYEQFPAVGGEMQITDQRFTLAHLLKQLTGIDVKDSDTGLVTLGGIPASRR